MNASRYQINEPDVTFESFEGELLVINLGNGNYYSLRGSAVLIWPWLVNGYSVSEIAAIWKDQADHAVAIEAFLEQLTAEQLVRVRTDHPTDAIQAPDDLADFTPPSLESYTDMQDLLMLDPIHEVDVTGWPKQAPEKPTNA